VTLHRYDGKNNLLETVRPKGVANGTGVTCSTNLSGGVNTLYATTLAYDAATQTKLESVTRRYTDPDLPGTQTAVTKYEYDAGHPGRVSKVIPPRGNTAGTPDYEYATLYTYYPAASGTARSVFPVGRRRTAATCSGQASVRHIMDYGATIPSSLASATGAK
jgi:hypothetical protein